MSFMSYRRVGVACLLGGLLAGSAFCQTGEPDVAAARKVADAVAPSVVNVEFVIKLAISQEGGESQKHEQKSETNGTVIDPSGLTVVSLSTVDPTATLGALIRNEGVNMQSQLTDIKYHLADGTEVPAKIVLRDRDQDLAFLRPVTKPTTPMAAVDLTAQPSLDVLDPIIIVSRLSKVVNHTLGIRYDRVLGLLEKPRRRYIMNNSTAMPTELGCPAVTLDGKVAGIMVFKMLNAHGDDSGSLIGGSGNSLAPVIVPAKDVQSAAVQAPEDAPADKPIVDAPTKPKTAVPVKPKAKK